MNPAFVTKSKCSLKCTHKSDTAKIDKEQLLVFGVGADIIRPQTVPYQCVMWSRDYTKDSFVLFMFITGG